MKCLLLGHAIAVGVSVTTSTAIRGQIAFIFAAICTSPHAQDPPPANAFRRPVGAGAHRAPSNKRKRNGSWMVDIDYPWEVLPPL